MHPIAGDPVVLRRTGQRYAETAEAIRSAVSTLTQISQRGPMVSVAIDRVRRDAAQLAHEISQAERRYAETGEALSEYADALHAAQEDAQRAISDHGAAESDRAAAESRARSLRSDIRDLDSESAEGVANRLNRSLGLVLGDIDEASAGAASAQRRYDAQQKEEAA